MSIMAESVKEMTSKFGKLEKFEGADFRRWQKKMHFLLTTLKVVYVLSTPIPEIMEDETLEQTRRRGKWENDDYICRGHILNGMCDSLFDIYQSAENAKDLWDSLESKYIAEDASSKKFLVSDFNNYKMVDSRPVMEQYHEILRILGQFTLHKMNMDESIAVSSVIDKLPPSWKDFKHNLKHQKEELSLVQLGSHLRIEESLRVQENDKSKSKVESGQPSVNMVEEKKTNSNNQGKGKKRKFDGPNKSFKKKKDLVCWRCNKVGHTKRDCRVKLNNNGAGTSGSGAGSKDQAQVKGGQFLTNFDNKSENIYYVSLIPESFYVQDDDCAWWVDSGATCHVCKDQRWFEKLTPVEDGSVLNMGNESTAPICGFGVVNLEFTSGNHVD